MELNQSRSAGEGRKHFLWHTLPRGLALFLGGFSLLNIAGDFRAAHFDATTWWVDVRFLPQSAARYLLLAAALCLIGFALRPRCSGWRRWLTLGCVGLLALVTLTNSIQFYALLAKHLVAAGLWVPLSFFISSGLALILAATWRTGSKEKSESPHVGSYDLQTGGRGWPAVAGIGLACAVAFPLAQMFCFGKTDYRRPADVAVVLGARVYADGHPSDALADRVRTACALYRDGLTHKLLFSGGPGDGAVPEAEAMKRMALRLGVRADDILLDEAGLNTQATVRNSEAFFSRLGASRILVVSHFYHLPRIKLAYERAGRAVYTVPARESYWLRQLPYNMMREVAAYWVYYLRPLGTKLQYDGK